MYWLWVAYAEPDDSREKIAFYLNRRSKEQKSLTVTLDRSRQEIADSFGIQKFSLIRTLAEMEQDGVIKIENRAITILNPQALHRWICLPTHFALSLTIWLKNELGLDVITEEKLPFQCEKNTFELEILYLCSRNIVGQIDFVKLL